MSNRFLTIAASVGLLAALAATAAHAGLGDELVAGGGNIVIRFEGSNASFQSLISVNGGAGIFPSATTPVGTTVDLGFFAAGTPLDIVLNVVTTGNQFRTGPGSGNPDLLPHAFVTYDFLEAGRTGVGFEDILGGGDNDFNDHTFSFTNIRSVNAIPEPETYALMLAGLGCVGWMARRRRTVQR